MSHIITRQSYLGFVIIGLCLLLSAYVDKLKSR